MRRVQITLDEGLANDMDRVVKKLKTTRSAFTRSALHLLIRMHSVAEAERRHRKGYAVHPVEASEFDAWEGERAWGDA